ncbi:MAG: hypothetical protein HQ515_26860, partial [Phycisphaeraceae bacterium]|nr:hypothetical protein [Phycisphaeraceae bacterium]
LEDNVIYDVDQKAGAKNSAIRFNVSNRDWHIWINNAFDTADQAPEVAKGLAGKAGLEPKYKSLLKDGPN